MSAAPERRMPLSERGKRTLDTAFLRSGLHRRYAPTGVYCPVLLYHGVTETPQPWDVTPERFRRQIEWISRTFEVLSLSAAVRRWRAGTLPSAPAVVTFDDGLASTLECAVPILDRHDITATHYIAPGLLGGEFEGSAVMSAEQLEGLRRRGQEIGAHTMTHPDLTSLSSRRARAEIERSGAVLEDVAGEHPRSFAYPYGAFDRELAAVVDDTGFETAATVVASDVVDFGSPFSIPRIPIRRGYDLEDVKALLSGARRWQIMWQTAVDRTVNRVLPGLSIR